MDFLIHLGSLMALYSIAAIGVTLISGYAGLITLSHGGFMGVGAYSAAYFLLQGYSFAVAIFLAIIIVLFIALLVSFPALKLRDDSYVLVSFGIAFIFNNLFFNLTSLTNGALGIKGIDRPFDGFWYFLLILTTLFLVTLIAHRITSSSYGIILKASRDSVSGAQIAGHNTLSYQRSLFIISAGFCGLAGVFLGSFISSIDPILFSSHLSVMLLFMAIIGGLASLKGAVFGAVFVTLVPELLRFAQFPHSVIAESQQITYGIFLILLMVLRPKGMCGKYSL